MWQRLDGSQVLGRHTFACVVCLFNGWANDTRKSSSYLPSLPSLLLIRFIAGPLRALPVESQHKQPGWITLVAIKSNAFIFSPLTLKNKKSTDKIFSEKNNNWMHKSFVTLIIEFLSPLKLKLKLSLKGKNALVLRVNTYTLSFSLSRTHWWGTVSVSLQLSALGS